MGNEYKAVHQMLDEDCTLQASEHRACGVLMLGFRFLAWLNGVGVLLVVLCALGIIPVDLGAYFLKVPLTLFLCGLALAGLGLLWLYMLQASTATRVRASRRFQLIPVFCVVASYCISMVMFAAGCWLLVSMGGFADADQLHNTEGLAHPQYQSAPLKTAVNRPFT